MLKYVSSLIVSTMLIGNAFAICEADKISYFKVNQLFNDETTVNIPLKTDGKQACYHQTSTLSIVADKINYSSVDFIISPLVAEFENIPEPKSHHFVFFENDSKNESTNIRLISYLCSGEIPVGADAISDSLARLTEMSNENKEDENIFIQTGNPSEGISVSPEMKVKAKIYDKFLELYEERTGIDAIEDMEANVYVPNVASGFSDHSIHRKMYLNFFTRTSSSVNGCSKKFLAAMQDLLIDNVSKTHPFKGIVIKKKYFSNNYWLSWTP